MFVYLYHNVPWVILPKNGNQQIEKQYIGDHHKHSQQNWREPI